MAIRSNDDEAVVPHRTGEEAARGDADSANFGPASLGARDPFLPLELLRTAIKRLFQKRTGRVATLAVPRRSEFRLALRSVDLANFHLVEGQLASRFRQNWLHNNDALHAAG